MLEFVENRQLKIKSRKTLYWFYSASHFSSISLPLLKIN
ncbi:unnamed protein product [Brugia timori]|uniref:Uncharacterized protein n=1 Tax=Brugia timori TaxID=42155 RepID=A0A3P7UP37_9BILA|nr:unnamed protein product [Brugia timori]